jgi:hypothetical protein
MKFIEDLKRYLKGRIKNYIHGKVLFVPDIL